MLKRNVIYTNFDGEEVTEELCFHLSKAELIQMEVEEPEGLEAKFKRVSTSNDGKLIISTMKDIILRSYGVRDGNRFRKSPQIREEFESSEAFSELFMELATNAESAAAFIVGVLPQGLDKEVANIVEKANEEVVKVREISQREAMDMNQAELVAALQAGATLKES